MHPPDIQKKSNSLFKYTNCYAMFMLTMSSIKNICTIFYVHKSTPNPSPKPTAYTRKESSPGKITLTEKYVSVITLWP